MKEEIRQNYLFSKKLKMVYFDLNMGMIDPQNSKLFRADVLLELTVLLTRVLQLLDHQSLLKQYDSKKFKLRWNNRRTTKNNSWKQFIVGKTHPEKIPRGGSKLFSLYTDLVLFFFSFLWKTSACSRARRERKIPLLRWWSINPPRIIFYHARSTDFEEKIEGLWRG